MNELSYLFAGIILGAIIMAWFLRSTFKANMERWEAEIKTRGVQEYLSQSQEKEK